jgi:hypothetical protein
MAQFVIGETDFGVADDTSRLELAPGPDGRLLLTVDIHGSQEVYDRIKDDPEWSWTLYPPHFYLHAYPVSAAARAKTVTVKLKPEDLDDYDVAVYMMEHNNVEGVTLKVSESQVEVSGSVDLMGEPRDFHIHWARPRGGAASRPKRRAP